MNILIIGGTGLISTRITQQLLARGDDVTHYNVVTVVTVATVAADLGVSRWVAMSGPSSVTEPITQCLRSR